MALILKKVIKDKGLEVKRGVARMGHTTTVLSQHINDNPSVEVLERIPKSIGCDISELFEPLRQGDKDKNRIIWVNL